MKWLVVFVAAVLVVGAISLRPEGTTASVQFNTSHDCTFCHGLHGAPGDQLLNDTRVESLCLSCHGPGGPSVLKADVHVYSNSTCLDCHVPHSNQQNWLGGTNLKLVRDSVIDPLNGVMRPVVFENRGQNPSNPQAPTLHSFCDGDEDGNGIWDGPCDTCHTDLGRHNYPEPQSHAHQQGNTCTRCHEHVQRFKP